MIHTRRTVVKALALISMAQLLRVPVFAQARFDTTDLGKGLTLISGAGANVVVAVGADSVVIVDGGHEAHADALLAEIDRISGGKPIAALFNTNWRDDKTGLNHILGPRGVPIIAHENTRLWQNAEFVIEWQDTTHVPMASDVQANQTFYKTGSMPFDGGDIEYGWLGPVNSDGDMYVRFPGSDLLVVGDAVGNGSYPLLDYVTGGWITGAREATDDLLAMAGESTRIVASQGPAFERAQLQQQADMLAHAYDRVAEAFKTGRSLTQFREADPMAPFNAQWGDPALFLALLYKGTWYRIPGRAVQGII